MSKIKGVTINLFFRSFAILAKFLLVIYISKALTLETLGLYNLIAVTVAWMVYIVGFEFYSYSLREIAGEKNATVSNFIFNQILFHLAGFAFLFLVSPVLVFVGFIPLELIGYFILITILDQLSQECYRILITLERPQFANVLYFVKSGLWVYPLLALVVMGEIIQIHVILIAWLLGTAGALLMGVAKLMKLGIINLQNVKIDVKWIKQGIKVAFPFMIISIAQQTMDFSDRYLVDYFLGKEKLGIYSFYYGIANVPMALITSVLVSQFYPKIINAYKFEIPYAEKKKVNKNFLIQCIGFGIAISTTILILLPYLLNFIDKQQLQQQINLFYLMTVQIFLFSIQIVVQTILYAKRRDHILLYTAVASAIINVAFNILLIPYLGLSGSVLATIISLLIMLLLRTYQLVKKIN